MKSFQQWLEVYHGAIGRLKNYLKNKNFDLIDHLYVFRAWKNHKNILNKLNIENIDDENYQDINKIENYFNSKLGAKDKEDFIDFMNDYYFRFSPEDAPTWMSMTDPSLLKRETWLVHFTSHENALSIMKQGFTRGVDDMTKIALTTYAHNSMKDFGGYVFAFQADSRDAKFAEKQKKYGEDAIVFQSAGVKAFHHGDTENQIMVWGPSIPKNNLIHMVKNDDWYVLPRKGINKNLFHGDFESVIEWIKNNWYQYRRLLFK